MIKRLFTLWLLMAAATGLLSAANSLELQGLEGRPGATVTVCVALSSDTPAEGLQLSIALPEGTSYVAGSAAPAGRAAAMKASGGVRDGRLNIMLYGLGGESIAAGSGTVATFDLLLGPTPGYAVLGPTAVLAAADGSKIDVACPAATLAIHGAAIAITDREKAMGRVALGEPVSLSVPVRNSGTETLEITGLDGSGDFALVQPATIAAGSTGSVAMTFTPTVRGVADAVLRFSGNAAGEDAPFIVHFEGYGRNEVSLAAESAIGGEEGTVSVRLKNYDPICGFTLRVTMPRGFTYVPGSFAIADERGDGHAITSSATIDKDDRTTLTLTAYSFSNRPFVGNDGTVATFRVLAASRTGATISVAKAVLPTLLDDKVVDVVSATANTYMSVSSPTFNVSRSQNLGRTPITQAELGSMSFRNTGNAPLIVTAIDCDPELVPEVELPVTVAPWAYASIPFSRTDENRGLLSHCILLHSNDPEAPVLTVDLSMDRYSPNELALATADTDLGDPIAIAVDLDNYDAIEGLQFDLVYPEELAGSISGAVATRAEGFKVSATAIEPGRARVVAYSFGAAIARGRGRVMTLTVTPDAEAQLGSYSFRAENIVLGDRSMTNLHSHTVEARATATVIPWLLGDVNRDMIINTTDVNLILEHMSNPDASLLEIKLGDMTGDKLVNTTDLNEILKIISKH